MNLDCEFVLNYFILFFIYIRREQSPNMLKLCRLWRKIPPNVVIQKHLDSIRRLSKDGYYFKHIKVQSFLNIYFFNELDPYKVFTNMSF